MAALGDIDTDNEHNIHLNVDLQTVLIDVYKRQEYERVLPASSVANLFPFNYSGKTDRKGFYIGKDKYGSNIVVDFDQRDEDKTSANVLILGNSGQGKSYLMKLLLLNFLEAGKSVITFDVEHEQWELLSLIHI